MSGAYDAAPAHAELQGDFTLMDYSCEMMLSYKILAKFQAPEIVACSLLIRLSI